MIKNFIYLDEERMYSLSSQIFEGITEYVLSESNHENQESESQKGPVGSGRLLANVIRNNNKSTEKKFLHDYSFTIFERHLEEKNLILDLSNKDLKLDDVKASINDFSFIKIKSTATFSDANKITDVLSEFNDIGKAITHVQAHASLKKQEDMLEELKSQTNDRNKKSKLNSIHKISTDITKLAKEKGLHADEKFLKNLTLLRGFNSLVQSVDESQTILDWGF